LSEASISSPTIGIVGGSGWLGGAIADAMLSAGLITPGRLWLSSRRQSRSRFPDACWTTDNQTLANRCDVIILSVRPADWQALSMDAGGKLVVSVMAGIRLSAICGRHNTRRAVRSLPNAAAEVRKSYTPWIAAPDASDRDRAVVRAIFDACGAQDEVAGERDIDYLTGLTGSGPAFPALLAAAMMDHAVAFGLPPETARKAVNALLVATGRMLERRDEAPRETVDKFLDYRGTTAAGIEAMLDAGFSRAVAQGLDAAYEKSIRMGAG
jgi:pyrroline-5-carboxylate reductase